jgi:hypothetical protein
MALKIGQTSFEKGIEKGELAMVRKQIERRFGALPASALKRLEAMSATEIENIGFAILSAGSLEELGLAQEPPPMA